MWIGALKGNGEKRRKRYWKGGIKNDEEKPKGKLRFNNQRLPNRDPEEQ